VEKSIHLVTRVMNERLPNVIDGVDENLLEELVSMLDELKQLSAALDVRSVCTLSLIFLVFFAVIQNGSIFFPFMMKSVNGYNFLMVLSNSIHVDGWDQLLLCLKTLVYLVTLEYKNLPIFLFLTCFFLSSSLYIAFSVNQNLETICQQLENFPIDCCQEGQMWNLS
jgi:hypothetical protein